MLFGQLWNLNLKKNILFYIFKHQDSKDTLPDILFAYSFVNSGAVSVNVSKENNFGVYAYVIGKKMISHLIHYKKVHKEHLHPEKDEIKVSCFLSSNIF